MFAYPINPLDVSVSDRIEEVKILRELCDILDVYGQKYWLDSGTLLGAFREGKILGHDADIDICCLVNHEDFWWSRKQVKLLNLIQTKFYIKYFIANEVISIFPRNYVNFKMNHIDIYLCDTFDKNIRMNRFPEIIFRNFHICDLIDINLNNINFPCMQHCEKFLSWKYGPDWNIPRYDGFSPDIPLTSYDKYITIYVDKTIPNFQIVVDKLSQLFDEVIVDENLKFKATYVYTDNYCVAKNNNKLYHFLKI